MARTRRSSDWRQRCRQLGRTLAQREILLALLVAVVTIVVAVALSYENNKLVPPNPAATAHYTAEPTNHLRFLSNWDGPIYLSIATHGYTNAGQANFFPLYPLLVRLVHTVVGSPLYSGLLVAWACFAGAVYFWLKIMKHLFGITNNLEALRGALFFVLFPTGVFLLATYTESLFALLSLGALYFALKKRYAWAVAATALVTATRADGVFVVILLGLLMWEQRAKLLQIVPAVVAGCAGLFAYMAYLQLHFHGALEFVRAQQSHSGLNTEPHHLLSVLATRNLIFVILLILAVLYWWRRRKSFAAYTFLFLCIVLISSNGLSGFGRYTLLAFPVEFMLYDYFRDKRLGYSIALAVSAILWAYFLLQYVAGYTGG